MCIFASILNCSLVNQNNSIMNGWKYRSKGLLKAIFSHQKVTKKQSSSAWNFQLPIPVCRGTYIPYFKINAPTLCCFLFSKNYFNLQARIKKMLNKHTVNYHPSLSQSTSRIYPFIFLWTPKGFISLESCLNFYLYLYIPAWLQKSFKIMVLCALITSKYICESKNWIGSFILMPQAELFPRFL